MRHLSRPTKSWVDKYGAASSELSDAAAEEFGLRKSLAMFSIKFQSSLRKAWYSQSVTRNPVSVSVWRALFKIHILYAIAYY